MDVGAAVAVDAVHARLEMHVGRGLVEVVRVVLVGQVVRRVVPMKPAPEHRGARWVQASARALSIPLKRRSDAAASIVTGRARAGGGVAGELVTLGVGHGLLVDPRVTAGVEAGLEVGHVTRRAAR
jgi:hypothetical protein